jgi:NhaP-type Na+/H+ or K+/H+ antiporter
MESPGSIEFILIIGLGLAAQWVAWRFSFPAIILMLVTGLIVGPGLGWIKPSSDFGAALGPIISLCVAVILFEGGMSLRMHELKHVAHGVRRLVTLGAVFNFLFGALAAHYLGGLHWPVSMVLAAILVVTGPTVIMPLLRQAMLNRRVASYLKWEAIINDPIGALLAVLVFQYFLYAKDNDNVAYSQIFERLGLAISAALLLGGAGGYLLVQMFRRAWVPEFLKGPWLLAFVLITFVISNEIQPEAGLLTVTVLGMTIGNFGLPNLDEMRRFKEYITVLLISSVFILLAADLNLQQLAQMGWREIVLVLAIMFLVRPLSIMLATIGTDMSWRERMLVSLIGPRGIVAAAMAGIFARELSQAGYPQAILLVPIVFSVIVATVVVHGLGLSWLARRLGLRIEGRENSLLIVGASPWTIGLAKTLQDLGCKILLVDSSWYSLRAARLAGVPVYFGEILSERAQQSLGLYEYANLITATSNAAYNALVCNTLMPEFGRINVYQLPMGRMSQDDVRGFAQDVRGRIAFQPQAEFDELWRRHHAGWQFQKTRLTNNYTYADFQAKASPDDILVLMITTGGQVVINSPQRPLQPKSGDVLVSYIPPKGEVAPVVVDTELAPKRARLPD